ncbi:MAG: hypothetical protein AABX48_03025 [Nanoarchaeota archaeon]
MKVRDSKVKVVEWYEDIRKFSLRYRKDGNYVFDTKWYELFFGISWGQEYGVMEGIVETAGKIWRRAGETKLLLAQKVGVRINSPENKVLIKNQNGVDDNGIIRSQKNDHPSRIITVNQLEGSVYIEFM